MLKRIVLSTVTLAVVTLIGCGGPPKDLIDKATMAQKKAMEAKADVYAKDDFDAATAAMTKGSEAVKKSDWDGAKKAYTEAATKFDAATAAAPAAMEAMKTELTARLAKGEADHAKMMADKAMMKKIGMMKKDDKAKADKMMADCKAALAAAKAALDGGDLMEAKAQMDKDDQIHADMMAMLAPPKKK